MNELRQRRVTLVVHDAPVAIWFAGGDEANLGVLLELLDEEQLGWGLPRDAETLWSAVNERAGARMVLGTASSGAGCTTGSASRRSPWAGESGRRERRQVPARSSHRRNLDVPSQCEFG